MRAVEGCLLARMGQLDKGARDAAVRRQVGVRQEQLAREESITHYQERQGQRGANEGKATALN